MEEFLQQYGYLALFVGTFLEGETILIVAGFLAFRAYLDIEYVVFYAFAGTLLGDRFWFYLGRGHERSFILRRPAWRRPPSCHALSMSCGPSKCRTFSVSGAADPFTSIATGRCLGVQICIERWRTISILPASRPG